VLHGIVERVLGSAVAADQPLMEVMQAFRRHLADAVRCVPWTAMLRLQLPMAGKYQGAAAPL